MAYLSIIIVQYLKPLQSWFYFSISNDDRCNLKCRKLRCNSSMVLTVMRIKLWRGQKPNQGKTIFTKSKNREPWSTPALDKWSASPLASLKIWGKKKKKSAVVTSGGRRPRGASQSISVMRRTPSSNLSTKIIIELHQEFVRMHLDVPHLACSFNLY